ncbi:hypothetical protein A8B98_02070 [Hymenobacter sp. UV11]|nr:hypothetical protein A8B98_02070 [Hymenobacter sp. UV11]
MVRPFADKQAAYEERCALAQSSFTKGVRHQAAIQCGEVAARRERGKIDWGRARVRKILAR